MRHILRHRHTRQQQRRDLKNSVGQQGRQKQGRGQPLAPVNTPHDPQQDSIGQQSKDRQKQEGGQAIDGGEEHGPPVVQQQAKDGQVSRLVQNAFLRDLPDKGVNQGGGLLRRGEGGGTAQKGSHRQGDGAPEQQLGKIRPEKIPQ